LFSFSFKEESYRGGRLLPEPKAIVAIEAAAAKHLSPSRGSIL
jgi:hypothetical protein